MSDALREAARRHIESRFRAGVERDVAWAAAVQCEQAGLRTPDGLDAAALCADHADLTGLIWSHFSPDWQDVVYVYDGTQGEGGRYLQLKAAAVAAYAQAGARFTPAVRAAALQAAWALRDLWTAWAGYQATTTDDLAHAVGEFEHHL